MATTPRVIGTKTLNQVRRGDLVATPIETTGLAEVAHIARQTIPANVDYGGYRSNQRRTFYVIKLADGYEIKGASDDQVATWRRED